MKTPREILLKHHREAEPKLDEVRNKALAAVAASSRAETSKAGDVYVLIRGALKKSWMELIWSSRRAWAGMCVLWLVVGAANLEMKNSVRGVSPSHSAPIREFAQGLEEQRRLLSELLETPKTRSAVPPHDITRPRSERRLTLRPC